MTDSARGAALMAFSMLLYAIENTIVKSLTAVLPIWQILMMTSCGGMIIFASITRARGLPILTLSLLSLPILLRSFGEILGALGFILALALVPLTTFSAILQAQPMMVTLGAALFLGERIGWKRWLAVAVGFGGVLLIIRPGMADFDTYALFALVSAVGLALRDLISKRLVRDIHTVQLSTWGFAVSLMAGALLMPHGAPAQMPTMLMLGSIAIVLTISASAYYAITASTRLAQASFVAPFRYTRLLFALALGSIVFGEAPDVPTIIGAVMIILSGLYSLTRGQA